MASIVLREKECLDFFNNKHCIVLYGPRVVVTHWQYDPTLQKTKPVFLKTEELKKLYANYVVAIAGRKERVSAVDWWLEHKSRRQANSVVFDPSEHSNDHFNLWRGFSIEPKEKDCSQFLEFIREVICDCDAELFNFIIGYFAHMVQRPSELPGTALILTGRQGTGKSFAVNQFAKLISEHTLTISQRRQLVGGFNAHMAHTILLVADEVSVGTRFATNALKAPITERTIMMEAKGHDAVAIANCIRHVLITNDPHAAVIDPAERRFAVFEVGDKHRQDYAYFDDLARYMDNGGLQGLMYHLQNYDLSKFNVRKVPRSKGFARQVEQSLTDVEKYWRVRMLAGELPAGKPWPKQIEKTKLGDDYQEFCNEVGVRRRSAETILGRNLKKMCPSIGETRPGGKRHFILPSLDECQKAFNGYTNIDWNWEE